MSGRKRIQICPIWLESTARAIREKKTTVIEASKNARVIINRGKYLPRTVITKKVCPATVMQAIKDNGLDVQLKKGRQKVTMRQEIREKILEIQKMYKTGVTKSYYQVVAESASDPMCKEITHQMINNVMEESDLLSFKRPLKKEEPYRCQYEASNPDLGAILQPWEI